MEPNKITVPPSNGVRLDAIEIPPICVLREGMQEIIWWGEPHYMIVHWSRRSRRHGAPRDLVACSMDTCPLCDRRPRGWVAFTAGARLATSVSGHLVWLPCVHMLSAVQWCILADDHRDQVIRVTVPHDDGCWITGRAPVVHVVPLDQCAVVDRCYVDVVTAVEMFLGIRTQHIIDIGARP